MHTGYEKLRTFASLDPTSVLNLLDHTLHYDALFPIATCSWLEQLIEDV